MAGYVGHWQWGVTNGMQLSGNEDGSTLSQVLGECFIRYYYWGTQGNSERKSYCLIMISFASVLWSFITNEINIFVSLASN